MARNRKILIERITSDTQYRRTSGPLWQPSVDVYRCPEGWKIKFDLAGVSLDDVQPSSDPLNRTLSLLKAKQPVKVLAMPPFDEHIAKALKSIAPDVPVEVVLWSPEGKTLPQLEQDAKDRVRAIKPDLVIIAVPRTATADSTESFIHSYAWVMNWSLSFGRRGRSGGAATKMKASRRLVHGPR